MLDRGELVSEDEAKRLVRDKFHGLPSPLRAQSKSGGHLLWHIWAFHSGERQNYEIATVHMETGEVEETHNMQLFDLRPKSG